MLRPRIIPCLLIQNGGLVKTIGFEKPKYVGDPINAVKIFNEKEVDELIVLDIDASANNLTPNFDLIRKLAFECRMPFCYGGGITTVEQAIKIINLGAEKIAISASAINNLSLLVDIGKAIGQQSVVVVIDVRKRKKMFSSPVYDIYIHNGKTKANVTLNEYIHQLNKIGIGEIVINSIDNDGHLNGYDIDLITTVRNLTNFPLTILGGAGSLDHFRDLFHRFGIIGAAAGSFFVFRGKYKAVLITYPSREEIRSLYKNFQN